MPSIEPTVVIVPGLRDHVQDHWQTHLERTLRAVGRTVVLVQPMGREYLSCQARVAALEQTVQAVSMPVVLVAHSGGCIVLAHWAHQTTVAHRVLAAVLATPPDFDQPMPAGYPTREQLGAAGWLPVPRQALSFPSLVLASQDDPLGSFERVSGLAHAWGSEVVDLGRVGHLNPASGYGQWPQALYFVNRAGQGGESVTNDQTRG
jgi:uncharacterized protein